jgi:antitoxin (DNA-binding transcriptional repressor) of toxin-antitoxin stability system
MRRASIRDLRTHFPKVRRLVEEEGQLVVTDRGRPIMLLRAYEERKSGRFPRIDYYARLRRRMPRRISDAALRELDEASRAER